MTEPASIRYRNPGAMWGGNAVSKKWGEMGNVALKDGLNQNNHIAIFPDFVHGICAQIDLWRTPRYHNKRFADAIYIWSGKNWVQSYIDFVIKHDPAMTPDTIMSDALLSSPMGIAFLKAQAWHEAGKQYPAPDADWIEAQRRVFGGSAAPVPADIPHPEVTVRDTQWLQASLNKIGASPPLDVDGIVGPKLRAAIATFQTMHGLDSDGLIGPATMRAIDEALAPVVVAAPKPKPPEAGIPTSKPTPPAAKGFWASLLAILTRKV